MPGLGDCNHSLVVDWRVWDTERGWAIHRACLLCGVCYDRARFLAKLERAIRDRWHLGVSPWSAEELSS